MLRTIIKIDEEKCDGCGQCVPACAEGAIQVIDGKAKLVSETCCDGLGACLGECPCGAISLEEREADAFDVEAVKEHLSVVAKDAGETEEHTTVAGDKLPCGCPGSVARVIERTAPVCNTDESSPEGVLQSRLGNWPVQMKLLPVEAPYFCDAKLLIAADCVPFAFADFHRRFVEGRTVLIGCPKLDEVDYYHQKLIEIFSRNDIKSVDVVFMEVPCCFGLVHLVKSALEESDKDIPVSFTKIGIRGDILEAVREGASVEAM